MKCLINHSRVNRRTGESKNRDALGGDGVQPEEAHAPDERVSGLGRVRARFPRGQTAGNKAKTDGLERKDEKPRATDEITRLILENPI